LRARELRGGREVDSGTANTGIVLQKWRTVRWKLLILGKWFGASYGHPTDNEEWKMGGRVAGGVFVL
jgi:hypothetical protein